MPSREVQRTTVVRESLQPDPPTVVHQVAERPAVTTRPSAISVVYYILDVIEILLALRLVFRLLGANPNSPIVSFLYAITAPLIAPFAGIFRAPAVNGSVLEWSTLVAMIIYAIIAYLIVQLIRLSYRRRINT